MTDIVERLRIGARMLAQYHLEEDVLAAADEIERLLDELDQLRARMKKDPARGSRAFPE